MSISEQLERTGNNAYAGCLEGYPKKINYKPRAYPQVIKYMGSKAQILPFIAEGIEKVHEPGMPVVDLFSGACAISGGFGGFTKIISNDIQSYSSAISALYLREIGSLQHIDVVGLARKIVEVNRPRLPPGLSYPGKCELDEFLAIEERNRDLLNEEFDFPYHLFTKCYSGTWWSAEQCLWIDAIKESLDTLVRSSDITKNDYDIGLTCLMHAMAYASQGTGHYAQYRDAKTESSMNDINKYRQASVSALFERKMKSLVEWNRENVVDLGHEIMCEDYVDCLKKVEPSVVYADPPYAFVHYSRFYHAIETIVKYDYPELQIKGGKIVKGRYREDRHQSPFCIRTKVRQAFIDLFTGVRESNSNLLLSYSNTGMIGVSEIIAIAKEELEDYEVWFEDIDHDHMTMGRRGDRSRGVKEALVMAKRPK